MSQTHLQSFLLGTSVASSFDLSTRPSNHFVNWESTGIIFEIGIICVERIIFKIGIIYGITFDNFASSFDLSTCPIGKQIIQDLNNLQNIS
jgi:hypothetical protein